MDDKLEEILEYKQGWNIIKDEYLKIKNRNKDPHKKSFILYLESIHNVYNHINQYKEKRTTETGIYPVKQLVWINNKIIIVLMIYLLRSSFTPEIENQLERENLMKKPTILLLTAILILSFSACAGPDSPGGICLRNSRYRFVR